MDFELARLADVYRVESAENLATMEDALLALERHGSPDAELLKEVFRAAHTLKGNSATMGHEPVMRAAHELEDLLEGMREGSTPFTTELVTSLLEAVDGLRGLVSIATNGGNARAERSGPEAQGKEVTLRVAMKRLDTLLDLTGEITIARGRLGRDIARGAEVSPAQLAIAFAQLEQLHGALQEEVMKLRMVPLGPSFRLQHRTVRDVAQPGEKLVHLVIDGEDVEVDTSIAEHMRDPITHMIRNAVDHGIETPAERAASGKKPAATITLRAAHRAGAVVIELTDDGRGLDRARIVAKAEALGLVRNAATLTDEQAFGLIFESGFSTAASVTAVSGRGVGMDIVRKHVRALRGTIAVESTPGRGTTFTIRLPLTVAIIGGFTVRVGTARYVLPLESVEECVDFAAARAMGEREGVLNLRGAPVPYARLDDLLNGCAGAVTAGRERVVVLRHGDHRVGVVVDALEGECQAVIKPLGSTLQRVVGIAGSTILGSGQVALIVDVPYLVDLTTQASRGRNQPHAIRGAVHDSN